MGIVLGAIFVIYYFHYQKSVRGKAPISLEEVQVYLKSAKSISYGKKGVEIFDNAEQLIGKAFTTSPDCDDIKGYAGSTDSLIILDLKNEILGVSLRSSQDTPGHVEDVKDDYEFIERWQGKDFIKLSEIKDLEEHEIWAVSGATRTSECMAWGIIQKSKIYQNKNAALSFTFHWRDLVIASVVLIAILLTFTKLKEKPKWRLVGRWSIFVLIVAFGVDLLCFALFGGWAKNGIPIYSAAILAGFVVLMFIIPLTTRKQIYCQQICPHGLMQETLAQRVPSKYTWKISKDLKWALKFIPGLLIFFTVVVLIFELPFDLSNLEVFSAWYPTRASTICLVLFVLSLIFSAFVPKGYCKYACPTGRFLEYLRDAGKADKFSFSDKMAGLILVVLIAMAFLADKVSEVLL